MPSPKNARKDVPKKTPEKVEAKGVDLGQKLAAKRSQDFKSKIDQWNTAGADVLEEEDEAISTPDAHAPDMGEDDGKVEATARKEAKSTPTTPKRPDAGNTPAGKLSSGRLGVREIEPGRKAWVRRKSKPHTTTPPADVTDGVSPATKTKISQIPKSKAVPKLDSKSPGNAEVADLLTTKRSVTPRKRLVSDEHWRKDRLPKKDGDTPEKQKEKEKESAPKPKIVRRSVATVGLKVPPSIQDFKNDSEPEPEPVRRRALRRRPRSRSASREREPDRATPDYESSGMKVYIKRRSKSKPPDDGSRGRNALNTSESSLTAPSSVGRPSSATDITTPEATPTRDRAHRSSTDPHVKTTRRYVTSQPAHDRRDIVTVEYEDEVRALDPKRSKSPPAPEHTKRKDLSEGTKGSADIPFKTSSSKPPPRPVPKVYGNRIEGWLATMPDDPFTETTDPSLVPEALRVPHKAKTPPARDLDGEDDVEQRRSSIRRRRSRPDADKPDEYELLQPSRGKRNVVDDWAETTSLPLQRNGAVRSMRPAEHSRDGQSAGSRRVLRPSLEEPRRRIPKRNEYSTLGDTPLSSSAKRLATIASVSTLHDHRPGYPGESVISRASDGDEPARYGTVLRRRRTTKHSDLMSVLSLPREDDHAIAPARSIRTMRPRHDTVTAGDLMNEITTDELKYQRELRTLVDGVIPVLLQYVLSQHEKSGSRDISAKRDPTLTQPIINMGIALERLKASHRRIPMHDPNDLLMWAENTAKVYVDYLSVWRLGFNDIVVNLAPAEQAKKDRSNSWDDGLQRNEHGDLLDGDGERVDVAYLLKRPLIRIKDLSKSLSGINQMLPSKLAEDTLTTYEDLVARAKQRTNDERARLEDEAAAAIDPSRARDPRSLIPLTGVSIDRTRRVRARDFFDMEFFNSTGQQLDCRIEIIIRDDPPESGTRSDILFCEISPADRWLLFPPVLASHVSARLGDKEGEIVIMIRGMGSKGTEWRELLSLHAQEEQCAEWIEMLGTSPTPPRLTRRSSFNTLQSPRGQFTSGAPLTESDLPIGERAKPSASRWDGNEVNSVSNGASQPVYLDSQHRVQQKLPFTPLRGDHRDVPFDNADHELAEASFDITQRPGRNHPRSKSEWIPAGEASAKKGYGDLSASREKHASNESSVDEEDNLPQRPTLRKRTSSVPSMDLPTVNKIRKPSDVQTPSQRDPQPVVTKEPSSAPATLHNRPPTAINEGPKDRAADQRTPLHGIGLGTIPSFTPTFLKKHRRSSSPLKHEYEPSTATESSESELSEFDDNDSMTSESSAGEAVSTLGELKDFSRYVPMRPNVQPRPHEPPTPISPDRTTLGPSESASQAPYRNVPSTLNGGAKTAASIFTWSDNGSWMSMHPEECQIFVSPGLIEAFDLLQANVDMFQAGSTDQASPSTRGVKPLIALELTPWVPLRRGTAVDISIRSPPTPESVLRRGTNFMFRSGSPEECEKLYNLINRARIDNPTWIALQNARGPAQTSNWGEVMDRKNAARSDNNASSWLKTLSRKGSSYRSKGARSASVAGSQSSVGTVNSTFSALRQFGGTSKIFNIAKSTIMSKSKQSTRSSSDSLSSGVATPLPIDPSMGTPVGITNTKIRLYVRETTTRWRDLGQARLTIMLPARRDVSAPADPRITGLEKRVLVCGKKDNVMLDVTLGETCFERVARTGIAVSVWEEGVGPNGELGHVMATGGVVSSKSTVYMIQMKSERDAAYTFSMVGKLRY